MTRKSKIRDLKERFEKTLKKVGKKLRKLPVDVKRDEYIRTAVDEDISGRLNKEELNFLGGFREAKKHLKEISSIQTSIPKILIFDIETAPLESYHWGLWNQNIGLNQIKEDWTVLSWAAKWAGSDEVFYMDTSSQKDLRDDRKILEGIWKLLDEADITVTQNGVSFDHKKLNARFIQHGMKPPSSAKKLDTKLMAKKYFKFTSNKLEYMTDKLCTKYKKLKHGNFPGMALWTEYLKGNKEAAREMEEYNRYDVLSLEELFFKLLPWDNQIDFNTYIDSCEMHICTCGSVDSVKKGFYYTRTGKYQKYICKSCGKESRDRTNLLSKDKRKKTIRSKCNR